MSMEEPNEVAELRDQVAELTQMLQESQSDNESMARGCETTDCVSSAMKEAKRFRELARVLEARNKGIQTELWAMIKEAKRWKWKFEQAQKSLAKVPGEAS